MAWVEESFKNEPLGQHAREEALISMFLKV
jgi:hypothetical protein